MGHEIAEGYAFLVATLSADSQFVSLSPGGIWRGVAPIGTQPVFTVISYLSGNDTLTGNAYRILSRPLFQVKAVGPSDMTAQIMACATRIDTLLKRTSGTTANAYIDACYRESPFALDDPPVAGVAWSAVGGLYRMEIQLTN